MDGEIFDRRAELGKGVQSAFLFAPVEVVLPVVAQLSQIVEAGPIRPSRYVNRSGPPRASEPDAQVIELALRNINEK